MAITLQAPGLTRSRTPSRYAVELDHQYRNEFRVGLIRLSDFSAEESREVMTGPTP
ncbi:hypothetical protein FA13DRAFT_1732878 [Coprinellus micaceus]|uniref:Uncharacterized protein n=1 Tax=Coprinellus micaceus TaxID=71717 RepID=A0A4Y7TB83_COPMI|nr:hypothetical protein FA13DRAFT_1732878 [Coprinellus micaceus]